MNFRKIKINKKEGFTLIELLVVIAIIGMLSSIIMSSLNLAREKSRDARRLTDMRQIQTALELYYTDFSMYPDGASDCGGWDDSGIGTFIEGLVDNGSIVSVPGDPISIASCDSGYSYYHYSAGSPGTGCDATRGAFYVLGVRNMETSNNPHPTSPGWSCPSRDWQEEFDWVAGSFES